MQKSAAPVAVVAGHVCLDVTPDLGALNAEALESLLRPGGLTRVGASDVHAGGCVANAGLALVRLGVPARLIARVGRDAFGRLVRELLAATGAECALADDPDGSTSYSVVIAPPGVDRVFLHHEGANARFSETDVPDTLLAGARLLHFGYPPLMPLMCAGNGAALARLFGRARALGLATSLDMASVDPRTQAARVDWPALLAHVLPYTDFFLPSAEELCFMMSRPLHAAWLQRVGGGDVSAALDIERDVAPLGARLIALGAKVAVIKCGARGLYWRTAGKAAFDGMPLPTDAGVWAGREGFQPAYRPAKVVSATGAGDVSIAAFLASALEGCPPEACARRAAAAGACCVEACDAISGLPSLAALDARIAAGWETNP